MRTALLLAAAMACAVGLATGYAENLADIVLGEGYYLYRVTGPNVIVVPVKLRQSTGEVLVRYPDGTVDWVSAGKLMTRTQSNAADTATYLAAGAAVLCLLMPRECGAGSNTSAQTAPPSAAPPPSTDMAARPAAPPTPNRGGQTGFSYIVTNECSQPVQVAMGYVNLAGALATAGWWNLAPGERSALHDHQRQRILSTHTKWLYYARTTTAPLREWRGDVPLSFGGENLPMKVLEDSEGDNEWSLTCS